jgi:hypothetical protein
MIERVVYYATTATQSRTTVKTIICAVSVPAELSAFRQRNIALKVAKAEYPSAAIRGVVKRGQLPLRTQLAAKGCPVHEWEEA